MNENASLSEICIDLNARMTDTGYSLQIRGAIEDLAKFGLTLEEAVGKQFLFNGGTDTDEHGQAAEIVFRGVVTKDPVWGFLAVCDESGLHWRPVSEAQQAVQPDRYEDAVPG